MASPLIAQVRDADLTRVGILSDDDLATLKVFPVRNGVGTWELKLPHQVRSASGAWTRHAMAEELAKPGAGIIVDLPGGRRVTGPVVTPTYLETSGDPRGSWTFSGVTDSVILADRLAFPNPAIADAQASSTSRAYDVRTGPAETVMRAYVKANLIDAPSSRRDSRVSMGSTGTRGQTITKSARFPTLLELCQELAAPDGLLFDVVQVGDRLEFQTTVPTDLSDDIRLDVHADSLDAAKWASSGPAASDVIVLGDGEGTDRNIRTRTTAEAQALAAVYARRIEVAVDARGAENIAELDAKGDEVLATNGSRIDALELVPTAVNTRELGMKWWVGDLVTVNVAGVPVKASVASAAIESTPEGLFATAKVGDATGFDPDAATGARLTGVENRVSSLERTAEASPMPAGAITQFAGAAAPSGWLRCDGAAVSRSTYAALFAAIGTAYGTGNGSTTFNLPNLLGRVPVGMTPGQAEFDTLGKVGGAKEHTLTVAEMPSHNHGGTTGTGGSHSHSASSGSAGAHTHPASSASDGAHAHSINTIQATNTLSTAGGTTDDGGGSFAAGRDTGRYQRNISGSVNSNGAHTHDITVSSAGAHSHSVTVGDGGSHNHTIASQGGGAAHNNLQPFIALHYIIRT